jgi:hypothetical protein
MKARVRSKLRSSACLIGIVAGVVFFGSFEFAKMRAHSLPTHVEITPACAVEAARIALWEHEAATNDRRSDDFWLSPTSIQPERTFFRRDWETVALVGECGSVLLNISPVGHWPAHDVTPCEFWQTMQHVRLQI